MHPTVVNNFDRLIPYEVAVRIEQSSKIGPYLVYEEDDVILGYAFVSRLRGRKLSHHCIESRIFLKNGFGGRGIGFSLYSELLSQAASRYQAMLAGIAVSNIASIRLHEKCGFRKIAHFSESAKKFGQWVDIGFWESRV